jgi:hypothetical protein
MHGVLSHGHHWFVLAERCVARSLLVLLGLVLMVVGLGLGVTMVLLPIGIAFGLAGVGVVSWGALGEIPIDE